MNKSLFANVSMEDLRGGSVTVGDFTVEDYQLAETLVDVDQSLNAIYTRNNRMLYLSAALESFDGEIDETTQSVIDFAMEAYTGGEKRGFASRVARGVVHDLRAVVLIIYNFIKSGINMLIDWVLKMHRKFTAWRSSINKLDDSDVIPISVKTDFDKSRTSYNAGVNSLRTTKVYEFWGTASVGKAAVDPGVITVMNIFDKLVIETVNASGITNLKVEDAKGAPKDITVTGKQLKAQLTENLKIIDDGIKRIRELKAKENKIKVQASKWNNDDEEVIKNTYALLNNDYLIAVKLNKVWMTESYKYIQAAEKASPNKAADKDTDNVATESEKEAMFDYMLGDFLIHGQRPDSDISLEGGFFERLGKTIAANYLRSIAVLLDGLNILANSFNDILNRFDAVISELGNTDKVTVNVYPLDPDGYRDFMMYTNAALKRNEYKQALKIKKLTIGDTTYELDLKELKLNTSPSKLTKKSITYNKPEIAKLRETLNEASNYKWGTIIGGNTNYLKGLTDNVNREWFNAEERAISQFLIKTLSVINKAYLKESKVTVNALKSAI